MTAVAHLHSAQRDSMGLRLSLRVLQQQAFVAARLRETWQRLDRLRISQSKQMLHRWASCVREALRLVHAALSIWQAFMRLASAAVTRWAVRCRPLAASQIEFMPRMPSAQSSISPLVCPTHAFLSLAGCARRRSQYTIEEDLFGRVMARWRTPPTSHRLLRANLRSHRSPYAQCFGVHAAVKTTSLSPLPPGSCCFSRRRERGAIQHCTRHCVCW